MVPTKLRSSLAALAVLLGSGLGLAVYIDKGDPAIPNEIDDPYIQTIAESLDTPSEVKIAMVMGYYYESSNRVITKPYNDINGARSLGKKELWTVCMGITNAVLPRDQKIDPNKIYTPAECYNMEKIVYLNSYEEAKKHLIYWHSYGLFQRAVFIDFIHNKGSSAFSRSTMKRLANTGDLEGACKQNPRWKFAGSVVLPGLEIRGNANEELCLNW